MKRKKGKPEQKRGFLLKSGRKRNLKLKPSALEKKSRPEHGKKLNP
jgi:hypothetical protein